MDTTDDAPMSDRTRRQRRRPNRPAGRPIFAALSVGREVSMTTPKGSVESTHKVPTSHYNTKHCHAVVASLTRCAPVPNLTPGYALTHPTRYRHRSPLARIFKDQGTVHVKYRYGVCPSSPVSCLWSERANMYPVRVPEIVNFSSKSFAARRCGVLHSCAVALTRHGAVMSSCTGRSESPSGSFE